MERLFKKYLIYEIFPILKILMLEYKIFFFFSNNPQREKLIYFSCGFSFLP